MSRSSLPVILLAVGLLGGVGCRPVPVAYPETDTRHAAPTTTPTVVRPSSTNLPSRALSMSPLQEVEPRLSVLSSGR